MSAAARLGRRYEALPQRLQRLLHPIVAAYRLALGFTHPVFVCSGRSSSGIALCAAYAGSDLRQRSYYLGLLFGADPEIAYAGRFFFWRITGAVRKYYPECGLIVWEHAPAVRWLLKSRPHFLVPHWIKMEIDISRPMRAMEKISRSGYRNIARLISKYRYTFTRAEAPEDRAYFYERMYLPFAKARFGGTAYVQPYAAVFEKPGAASELYMLRENGRKVAGMVMLFDAGGPALGFFGVLDGRVDMLRRGALGAAYYFSIKVLQGRGHARVAIGDSRPFIHDGITRFKIRLLATLVNQQRYDYHRCCSLRLLKATAGIKDFLAGNPFMCFSEAGTLRGAFWAERGEACSGEDLQKALRRMQRGGIEQFDVHVFEPASAPAFPESGESSISVAIRDANTFFFN